MAEAVINTARGSMSPAGALEAFLAPVQHQLTMGAQVGIFNELCRKAPEEAQKAAAHVIADPAGYPDKMKSRASELVGERPVGWQSVKDSEHLLKTLAHLRVGDKFQFRLKKTATITELTYLLGMNGNILQLDSRSYGPAGVAVSCREWTCGREFTATAFSPILSDDGKRWFEGRLGKCLDAIHLLPR